MTQRYAHLAPEAFAEDFARFGGAHAAGVVASLEDEGAAPLTEPQPVGAGVGASSATEMLTYAQAAEYLNVPVGTLYDWVHRKVVPHVRLGPRLVRFPRSALVQWLEERSVDGRAVATLAGGREKLIALDVAGEEQALDELDQLQPGLKATATAFLAAACTRRDVAVRACSLVDGCRRRSS